MYDIQLKCYICEKMFTRKRWQVKNKTRFFCSNKCVGIYNSQQKKKIKKTCQVCGKEFIVKPYEYDRRKTCSTKCMGIKQRNKVKCNCHICGKEIYKTHSQLAKSKSGYVFCSNKCVGIYNSIIKSNMVSKTCIICGKEYKVKPAIADKSITCSRKCQGKWQSKFRIGENSSNYKGGGGYKTCINCKGEFYVYWKTDFETRKFCSTECKQEYWKEHVLLSDKFKKARFEGNVKQRQQGYHETKPEKMVKEFLKNNNIEFLQEELINDKFIVDFYLPNHNAIIEVFGDYWHGNPDKYGNQEGKTPLNENQKRQQGKDKARINYLKKCGYKVFVVWENDIYTDINKVMNKIIKYL